MKSIAQPMKQVVDWSAAVWAGLISGLIFLALNMLLTWNLLGTPWIIFRMIASVVMGSDVLPPPATFDLTIFLTALIIHLVLSVAFASLLAVIIHRWGLIVGFIGGALFGLVLFVINYYAISYFFPWFFPLRNWTIVLSHIAFGAFAGGLYESMEEEVFVPDTE